MNGAVILAALCVGLTAPAAGVVLTGRVIDAASGTPIVGAKVQTYETGETAVSDSSGAYKLTTHKRGSLVVVSSGDMNTEVRVHAQRDSVVHDFFLFHPAVFVWPDFIPDVWEEIPRRADAAVALALKMDADRQSELLHWLFKPRPKIAYYETPRPRPLWTHCSDCHSVSKPDIGAFGWDHALNQVPGVVVR